jgi:hypothetical protein
MWVLYSDGLKRPASPISNRRGHFRPLPCAVVGIYFFSFVCHESDEVGSKLDADLQHRRANSAQINLRCPEFHPVMTEAELFNSGVLKQRPRRADLGYFFDAHFDSSATMFADNPKVENLTTSDGFLIID